MTSYLLNITEDFQFPDILLILNTRYKYVIRIINRIPAKFWVENNIVKV